MHTHILPSNRSFGAFFGLLFLGIAIYLHVLHSIFIACPAYILAILVLILAYFYPKTLTTPNALWAKLGEALRRIVSPVILGLIYGLLFVPVGLLFRLSGRDELRVRTDSTGGESYWREVSETDLTIESLRRQY